MDFLQACFEFHRRYLSTGAGELLDDAMLELDAEDALDDEIGALTLELFLHDQVLEAVHSLQRYGVWTHPTEGPLYPGLHDSCTNARYRHKFV